MQSADACSEIEAEAAGTSTELASQSSYHLSLWQSLTSADVFCKSMSCLTREEQVSRKYAFEECKSAVSLMDECIDYVEHALDLSALNPSVSFLGTDSPLHATISKMPLEQKQSKSVRFRVLSLNILSDDYCNHHSYFYCDSLKLQWQFRVRRLVRLLRELQWPALVSLQEVDRPQCVTANRRVAANYHWAYVKRTRMKTDGCLLLWRKDMFRQIAHGKRAHVCEEKDSHADVRGDAHAHVCEDEGGDSHGDAHGHSDSGCGIGVVELNDLALLCETESHKNHYLRDNIGAYVLLTPKTATTCNSPVIVFATCHLYYHWLRADIRVRQMSYFINVLQRVSDSMRHCSERTTASGSPVQRPVQLIVTGDFNSQPNTSVHRFVLGGKHVAEAHGNSELKICVDPSLNKLARFMRSVGVDSVCFHGTYDGRDKVRFKPRKRCHAKREKKKAAKMKAAAAGIRKPVADETAADKCSSPSPSLSVDAKSPKTDAISVSATTTPSPILDESVLTESKAKSKLESISESVSKKASKKQRSKASGKEVTEESKTKEPMEEKSVKKKKKKASKGKGKAKKSPAFSMNSLVSSDYSAMFALCENEDRYLITRSKKLTSRRNCPRKHVLLRGSNNPRDSFMHLIEFFGLKYDAQMVYSRCALCNGNFEPMADDSEIAHCKMIPEALRSGWDLTKTPSEKVEFYRCLRCKQVYWWGCKTQTEADRIKATFEAVERRKMEDTGLDLKAVFGEGNEWKKGCLPNVDLHFWEDVHFRHAFEFESCATRNERGGEPEFTNKCAGFQGTLDYIFRHSDDGRLQCTYGDVLLLYAGPIPFPNSHWISDHLPVMAAFTLHL